MAPDLVPQSIFWGGLFRCKKKVKIRKSWANGNCHIHLKTEKR